MLRSVFALLFATVMWVQVPQWQNDWSQCAVDVPDVDCHWYVVAPDNTFGEGFDWASAPWFDPNAPIKIRQVFLNGQKTVSGTLPMETIIPAEDWVLKLRYEKADLQGYVTATVLNCPLR